MSGYWTPARLRMKPPVSKWLVAPSPSPRSSQRAPISPRANEPDRRVERDRLLRRDLEIELEMVLQVLADPGQVDDERDAVRLQLRRRPDAGQLQELRRVDRPAGKDHLARRRANSLVAVAAVADADRPPALEDDPRRPAHGCGPRGSAASSPA